jgi:hypothetical protein
MRFNVPLMVIALIAIPPALVLAIVGGILIFAAKALDP